MQGEIDALWREKSGMVLATLIRLLGDVDLAEEAMQQAFLAAARNWPSGGMPANPTAWLISAGRFRAIDQIRRHSRHRLAMADMCWAVDTSTDEVPHPLDLLALIFTCCHPALSQDAQVALTLRSLCGLTTEEIAAAFLQSVPTMAQRISRAKATLRDQAIPFGVPDDPAAQLGPVLAVIYLVFNQGYGANSSADGLRPDLSALALTLAQDLHAALPDPEVKGLLALMLFGVARQDGRIENGAIVPLADQNRALWDRGKIAAGLDLLDAAFASKNIGPYTLQAAIAALHASACRFEDTDWAEIAALYALLMRLAPGPIIALNRAVALTMAKGPAAAQDVIANLASGPLAGYAPAHAAHGEVLAQLGAHGPAICALQTALNLTQSPPLRHHLQGRIDMLRKGGIETQNSFEIASDLASFCLTNLRVNEDKFRQGFAMTQKPNILIVMVDQLTGTLFPDGPAPFLHVPNLRKLADHSVRFANAYTASPLCAPARASFMSGQLPRRTRVYDNAAEFASDIPTYAHHLRRAGYQTILSGKMHFVGPDQMHGFEARLTTDIYPADFGWTPDYRKPGERIDWWYHNLGSVTGAGVAEITNQLEYDDDVAHEAVQKIYDLSRKADARPWCLTVSFTHPHDPFVARRRYWDLYQGAPECEPPAALDYADMDPHSQRLMDACDWRSLNVTPDHIRRARQGYFANISYVDAKIGEIFDALEASRQEAIVVFLSDHGEMLGRKGL